MDIFIVVVVVLFLGLFILMSLSAASAHDLIDADDTQQYNNG